MVDDVRQRCSRAPRCARVAHRRGLCEQHYTNASRGYVDSTQVREHIAQLRAVGFTWRCLAEVTGRAERALIYMGPRCQVATAERILAIPLSEDRFCGNGFVSVVGTTRRVRALMAFGWTQGYIAQECGISARQLSDMLSSQKRVRAALAKQVAELFEKLQMTPGPSNWCRSYAVRKGWPPPWAWDEDVIDDPDGVPQKKCLRAGS